MEIKSVRAIPVSHVDHRGTAISLLFVCIENSDGVRGFGEACDSFGCNYPLSVKAVIDEALSPLLLDEAHANPDRLYDKLYGWTRRRLGDGGVAIQAISGVENALWDLLGRSRTTPVAELLGSRRNRIPVYASGTFLAAGDAVWHARFFEPCLERGVRAIKVRIGTSPGPDLTTLRELRRIVGDDIRIMVDGNEHFCARTALEIAKGLHDSGVALFEEPVPQCRRDQIRWLRERSPVPLAYGEHLYGVHDFIDCIDTGSLDVAQPDASICGGIGEARRIAARVNASAVSLMPHAAAGPVSFAANLHFCATVDKFDLLEYPFPLTEAWTRLVPGHPFMPDSLRDGSFAVPDDPGLGVTPDEHVLLQHRYRPRPPSREMPHASIGVI